MHKTKIKAYFTKLEGALLIGLAAAILFAAVGTQIQNALADKMLRLHVIANSDSYEDQALKYQVRDSVLHEVEQLTSDAATVGIAREDVKRVLRQFNKPQKKQSQTRGILTTYSFHLASPTFRPSITKGSRFLPVVMTLCGSSLATERVRTGGACYSRLFVQRPLLKKKP